MRHSGALRAARFLCRALTVSLLSIAGTARQSAAGAMSSQSGRQAADTVVRPAGKPVHPGVATLVEEASIGVAMGADEYMLGEVADIAVGDDGSIVVLDRQVPAVRIYDNRGRYVATAGRRGQGPGEYLSASGLAIARDGRILLWDTGNWRINIYSPQGKGLGEWRTPGSGSATFSRALTVDTAGVVYARRVLFSSARDAGRTVVWLRLRDDGTPLDTLRAPPMATERQLLVARAGNAMATSAVPFSANPIAVLSPLGWFVTALPARYAFELHPPGGGIVSVRRDVKPDPVTRSERDSARQSIEARMRRTDPAWSWNGPDIPAFKPAFTSLSVGLDGRIWVPLVPEVTPNVGSVNGPGGVGIGRGAPRPPAPSRRPSEAKPRPALYEVFEPDGTYLGQVQVPPRVSTVVRRGDYVWGVAYGEDDVASVKRYRIVWK